MEPGGEYRHGRARRRPRRWPLVLASCIVLLGTLAAVPLIAVSQVDRAFIEGLAPLPDRRLDQPEPLPEVLNVLLVGVDSRAGLTARERRELSTGAFAGARADTIMLVQVRTDGSAAALLSFPRDLRVTRCDGSVGRINGAYEIGAATGEGGSCVVRTVTGLSGVGVHHYVEVDLAGFVEVIDTLGGVELCTDRPLRDQKSGLDLAAGCQHVGGGQALAFARARGLDDDFGRIERQQLLLQALLDDVSAGELASDPVQALRVLARLAGAIRTDERLDLGTVRRLAGALRGLDSARVVAETVPADPRPVGGVAYLEARQPEAQALYAAFRDRSVLDRAAGAAAGAGG